MNEGASGGRSISLTNDHYPSPTVRDTPLTFSQQNFIKPDRTLPITHGPPMFFPSCQDAEATAACARWVDFGSHNLLNELQACRTTRQGYFRWGPERNCCSISMKLLNYLREMDVVSG